MRYLLLTVLLALGLLPRPAAGPGSHSHLFVEPGKQFSLGGDQPEGFRGAAHNTGPVPVALRKRLRTGAVVARGNLTPGQRATLRFAAGSAALARNASARRAGRALDIRGGHPGRMTYEPAGNNLKIICRPSNEMTLMPIAGANPGRAARCRLLESNY